MRNETISKLTSIVAGTRNPIPLLLDYAGVKRRPYRVVTRSGVVLELRPGLGDRFGFYEVAIREDYFESGQSIGPGDTVIDVGANVGCFALLAAKRVGPTGRVIAIEPEARTFEQLRRNIALNDADNVVALRLAIGAQRGSIDLYTSAESALFSSIYTQVNRSDVADGTQKVPMITLADLMSEHAIPRCDYLKLDCEGAEHDIIASLTAEAAACISQITLELHKVDGRDPVMIARKLHELGYDRIGERGLPYYRRQLHRAAA